MIGQISVLLRVKQLKEEQAFRAMNTKRQQVAEAAAAVEAARIRKDDSAATLPAREDAIYEEILQRVVGLTAIEEAKARVVVLEKEHAKLVDAYERAVHVHAKLAEELQVAVQAYRKTVKDRDKYVILTDELRAEHDAQLAQREEVEIEDIFSTRRRRAA
jgi:phage I-like protein